MSGGGLDLLSETTIEMPVVAWPVVDPRIGPCAPRFEFDEALRGMAARRRRPSPSGPRHRTGPRSRPRLRLQSITRPQLIAQPQLVPQPRPVPKSRSVPQPMTAPQPVVPRRPRMSPRHSIAAALGRARSWNGHDRRAIDPLSNLSRQLDHLCVNAVEATEIAAGLEAVGFTDGAAEEYGCPDVFHLAELLFARTRTGRGRSGRPRLANPWAERPRTHLARGLAFAAPGIIFVALLPATTMLRDRVALVVAMLLGWPGSQAMAFAGHTLEGRRHPAAARAALLAGAWVLAAAAVVFFGVATLAGVTGRIAILGAAQTLYLACSAVVLVLGRQRLALVMLLPGVLGAVLSLMPEKLSGTWLSGSWLSGPWLSGTGGAVTVIGAVVVAHVVAGRPRVVDLRTAVALLTREDRKGALWQVGYGVVGTLLVTLPSLAGFGDRLVSLCLVPVIWSMGLVEWRVVHLRRRSFDLLNEAITLPIFRTRVSRRLSATTAGYLAGLTLLTALVPVYGLTVMGTRPHQNPWPGSGSVRRSA